MIRPGKTTYHGDLVDIERFACREKHRLVMKKAQSAEGKQVFVGKYVPQDAWETTLGEALASRQWILQEFVEPDVKTLLVPGEAGFEETQASVTLSPYQKALLAILGQRHRQDDRLGPSLLPTNLLTPETLAMTADKHRSWVAKPSFGYGGHGILIGADLKRRDWEVFLQRQLDQQIPYVVQQHADPGRGFLWDDRLELRTVHANYSFWVIDGEFAGAFVRLSPRKVINTHQGGALVPVLYASS